MQHNENVHISLWWERFPEKWFCCIGELVLFLGHFWWKLPYCIWCSILLLITAAISGVLNSLLLWFASRSWVHVHVMTATDSWVVCCSLMIQLMSMCDPGRIYCIQKQQQARWSSHLICYFSLCLSCYLGFTSSRCKVTFLWSYIVMWNNLLCWSAAPGWHVGHLNAVWNKFLLWLKSFSFSSRCWSSVDVLGCRPLMGLKHCLKHVGRFEKHQCGVELLRKLKLQGMTIS